MAEDLENTIRENAANPAEVQGDSGRVKQHSLADQIAADRYRPTLDSTSLMSVGRSLPAGMRVIWPWPGARE